MQRNRMIIWAAILSTLVLSLLALLLPTPVSWPQVIDFHYVLIVNIIMACTHIGGVLLLLTNLDVYKAKLRRAYIVMSIGVLIAGAGMLQTLLLILFNGLLSTYAQSGATILPYLLSGLLLYVAVRSFARIIGVTHPLTRAWVAIPGAVLLTVLSSFLPHAKISGISEITFDVVIGLVIWPGSLMLFAGWLALKVRGHVGAHYTYAMSWLARAIMASASLLLSAAVVTLIQLPNNLLLNVLNQVLTLLSGLMWIRAGYAFALTKYYDEDIPLWRQLFGKTTTEYTKGPTTVVDMVIFAAGLVSNSSEIDPLLDDVRVVTAKLKPGEDPSSDDTRRLISVYLKLEQYLAKKEAIRTFTQKELRSHFTPMLQKLVYANEK